MASTKFARAEGVVLLLVAAALPLLTNEILGDYESHTDRAWYLRILDHNFWYRKFAPGGPRRARIDEVKIVSIVRNVEPGSVLGENRCSHRAFMAKLLMKLRSANPSLIVIDKWYNRIPPRVCAAQGDGTPALKRAIQAVSSQVPIIIAVGSFNKNDIHVHCPGLGPESLKPQEVVLDDYEPLAGEPPTGRVRYGLARLNRDNRKVPLGWVVFKDCGLVGRERGEMWPTLSLAAAMELEPDIMKDNDLDRLQQKVTHPYTKLVPGSRFGSISAIRLICNEARPSVDWTRCSETEGDAKTMKTLAHKIVIVAETWNDPHSTDQGEMAGGALHANYIASLLDESLLKPAPKWLTYTVSLGWAVLVLWIFHVRFPRFPELSVIVSMLSTLALGIFFSWVITRQWGIFADVVPPTLLETVLLYLERRLVLAFE